MYKVVEFIKKYSRSLVYSVTPALGLLLALQLLKDYGSEAFLAAIGATTFVILIEIYLNWRVATKIFQQIEMPTINAYNLLGNLLNHITLPLIAFLSFAGFIFLTSDDLIRIITILFSVFINSVLFINIQSYYQDEFDLEEDTRFIYDVVKLVIFFFCVNLILHVQIFLQIEVWISALWVCAIALILAGLLVYRRAQLGLATIAYVIVSSFIVATVYMLVNALEFTLLGMNIVTFLLFYFILSILHHKLERTLTLSVFSEYFLVFLLAMLLFAGIR